MSPPQPSDPLRAEAAQMFGPEPARGLFGELALRLGPPLAELLLRWLLDRQGGLPPPAAAAASPQDLWLWSVSVIKAHRNELTALLFERVDALVDVLLERLDGPAP
jgi:hypothetical protein